MEKKPPLGYEPSSGGQREPSAPRSSTGGKRIPSVWIGNRVMLASIVLLIAATAVMLVMKYFLLPPKVVEWNSPSTFEKITAQGNRLLLLAESNGSSALLFSDNGGLTWNEFQTGLDLNDLYTDWNNNKVYGVGDSGTFVSFELNDIVGTKGGSALSGDSRHVDSAGNLIRLDMFEGQAVAIDNKGYVFYPNSDEAPKRQALPATLAYAFKNDLAKDTRPKKTLPVTVRPAAPVVIPQSEEELALQKKLKDPRVNEKDRYYIESQLRGLV